MANPIFSQKLSIAFESLWYECMHLKETVRKKARHTYTSETWSWRHTKDSLKFWNQAEFILYQSPPQLDLRTIGASIYCPDSVNNPMAFSVFRRPSTVIWLYKYSLILISLFWRDSFSNNHRSNSYVPYFPLEDSVIVQ